jgi:hypothetical protein
MAVMAARTVFASPGLAAVTVLTATEKARIEHRDERSCRAEPVCGDKRRILKSRGILERAEVERIEQRKRETNGSSTA